MPTLSPFPFPLSSLSQIPSLEFLSYPIGFWDRVSRVHSCFHHTCYADKDHQLLIFLLLPPEWEYWDSRCTPPYQVNVVQWIKLEASYRLHKSNTKWDASTGPFVFLWYIVFMLLFLLVSFLYIDYSSKAWAITLLQRNIGRSQLGIVINQHFIMLKNSLFIILNWERHLNLLKVFKWDIF